MKDIYPVIGISPGNNYFKEVPLSGGRSALGVVRIGDTVHRPIGSRVEFTHALLKLLEEKGYTAAPRFLGIDENGREILSFIEGMVPHGEIQWTNDQLIKIVQMMRDFHDATAGSQLAGDKEVVCHNDIAPWNTVLENNIPKAFIDFDEAAPGNRVDDLAYFLWTFLKIGSDVSPDIQARKMRTLCSAYGYTYGANVVDAILEQQKKILSKREILTRIDSDQTVREFSESRATMIRSEIEWVKAHRSMLEKIHH